MREGKALPPCEPCLRCLALGESEEGGPPVPLGVKTHAQQSDGDQLGFSGWNEGK